MNSVARVDARIDRGVRRTGLALALVVGVLSFVGFLEFSTRSPVSFWSAILISAGLATVSARFVRRHNREFLRVSRVSSAPSAPSIVIPLSTAGGSSWAERRYVRPFLCRMPPQRTSY